MSISHKRTPPTLKIKARHIKVKHNFSCSLSISPYRLNKSKNLRRVEIFPFHSFKVEIGN